MIKKVFLYSLLNLIILSSISQVFNINPDTLGEPWTVGPGNSLGDTAALIIIKSEALESLPISADNSSEIYFHGIFNQSPLGGNYNSCAQAAGVTYTFGYEINRYRNANAGIDTGQFPQCYTWNYFNECENLGSTVSNGWDLIADNGSPNMLIWGNGMYDDTAWLSESAQYESGIWNRINSDGELDVQDTNDIEEIKAWLYNHNDTSSSSGGLGVFVQILNGYSWDSLGVGPMVDEEFLTGWGSGDAHAIVPNCAVLRT